ncbi:2-enoyl-CoA Hydrataseregion domain-containing protein [Rozella allomycis CSF55]|uniref:3-hydroxyisobutyryl-CoA hydrolase n=1 Tax=Rozella allomycis (strain CSF55) TaxID=988480 RepID=A0A075B004_ROZAC|nr:2-enoyl-CoA Hydrataseregion domain-containing protein [Rozella allomycis CSF55]|eukprot:EPZ35922.1 2-enoyl-CoA Hydrataseregion domain-containing protein [Rozella allomycis CSF55]
MIFHSRIRYLMLCRNRTYMPEYTVHKPPIDASTDNIKFTKEKLSRIITLHRPAALNALSHDMITSMHQELKRYSKSNGICSIIVRGAETEKVPSFCAGGDVVEKDKGVYEMRKNFFKDEYVLNSFIFNLDIPYISIMDGITMGGGVGVSIHGAIRIATERTVFAMPETIIGFFPDVGGSYFLPKLNGAFGMYLGLTGEKLKGTDVYFANIATHFVPSAYLNDLVTRLSNVESTDVEVFDKIIDEFRGEVDQFSYMPLLPTIEERVQAKTTHSNPIISDWANRTLKQLNEASPTSLAVSFHMLRNPKRTLWESLVREYVVSQNFMKNEDFYEGVKAKLIDKTGKPKWNPSSLKDISIPMVHSYFAGEPISSIDFFGDYVKENYSFYRLGLPKEFDLEQLIQKYSFPGIKDALSVIGRSCVKPGWKVYVEDILKRRTVTRNGKLEWK